MKPILLTVHGDTLLEYPSDKKRDDKVDERPGYQAPRRFLWLQSLRAQ